MMAFPVHVEVHPRSPDVYGPGPGTPHNRTGNSSHAAADGTSDDTVCIVDARLRRVASAPLGSNTTSSKRLPSSSRLKHQPLTRNDAAGGGGVPEMAPASTNGPTNPPPAHQQISTLSPTNSDIQHKDGLQLLVTHEESLGHGVLQVLEVAGTHHHSPEHTSPHSGPHLLRPTVARSGSVPLDDSNVTMAHTTRARVRAYFMKWVGVPGERPMPRDSLVEMMWTWLGAFVSVALIDVMHQYMTPIIQLEVLAASFGASAVLLFGVPESKLSQPRNLFGGHLIGSVIGCLMRVIVRDDLVWLSAALGMSLSLVLMQATQTLHPPGGATGLIASSAQIIGPAHGFKFVGTVMLACVVMLLVALVVNNFGSKRRYPTFWF